MNLCDCCAQKVSRAVQVRTHPIAQIVQILSIFFYLSVRKDDKIKRCQMAPMTVSERHTTVVGLYLL
nr:MAG TPA: hypothetical protein [Caudoviricetes sp.]DAV57149.1 MAG TPA: hypothetical protein [Caudoviricetes sp.]